MPAREEVTAFSIGREEARKDKCLTSHHPKERATATAGERRLVFA